MRVSNTLTYRRQGQSGPLPTIDASISILDAAERVGVDGGVPAGRGDFGAVQCK